MHDFLEEVQLTKQDKTWRGYKIALKYFQESCDKTHLTVRLFSAVSLFLRTLQEAKETNGSYDDGGVENNISCSRWPLRHTLTRHACYR